MPVVTPCAYPGCSALASVHGRCARHATARDRVRESAQARGYSKAWAKYSKARLERLPICGMQESGALDGTYSRCVRAGRLTPATVTDHIVPLSRGGSMWSAANHQSLCASCNTAKGNR